MATQILRVCLAQLNITVGDFKGNTKKIISAIKKAEKEKTDIICFPELAITGYPPEDLLLRPKFIKDNLAALDKVIKNTNNILAIVGFVDLPDHAYRQTSEKHGKHWDLYNAAALINNKEILSVYHKTCLPNYGVFDEKRYFTPGKTAQLVSVKGINVGVTICEDIWQTKGPLQKMAKNGAELIININASPYHKQKSFIRQKVLSKQAKQNNVTIIYNNLVGGQDELVFDGHGLIVDHVGQLVTSLPQFSEKLNFVDLQIEKPAQKCRIKLPPVKKRCKYQASLIPFLNEEEEVYSALKLGLHDYINKNNFKSVLIGLSGGIDSALTAAIAVDALGHDKVNTVFMPSQFT
jgi:NAD+ synthase (glutamine-hydrolysing)